MAGTDKSVDLYKLLNPKGKGAGVVNGIKIVRAVTAEPDAATFIFEGTKLALGSEIFEIPYNMYPIKKDDRFLTYPIINNGAASRWTLIQKINGCTVNLATMQGPTSLIIDGIAKTYTTDDLVVSSGLTAGKRVSVAPIYDSGSIKYAVIHVYE